MNSICKGAALLLLSILFPGFVVAEGSRELVAQKGYRLFLNVQQQQQFKVFAAAGEFIQVGSSHTGVAGGTIRVVRPDGTNHTVFANAGATQGLAVIYNKTQEFAGPTGGGSVNGAGYIPGIVEVGAEEGGVWTILFEYPQYSTSAFNNKLNTDDWIRLFDQPTNQRVVLAWDITVSKLKPVNEGGEEIKGRAYTQEYIAVINDSGNTTDARFFLASSEGVHYELQVEDMDPWGWSFSSNNRGLIDFHRLPVLTSLDNKDFTRSWMTANWVFGQVYQYEPQTSDLGHIANNKIFFNPPDPGMPATALDYDLFRSQKYTTWLNAPMPDYSKPLSEVSFKASPGGDPVYSNCGANGMAPGVGGHIMFRTTGWGMVTFDLDLNANGSFLDPVDLQITKFVTGGEDSLFWDGRDKLGNPLPPQVDFPLTVRFNGTIYNGEMHFLFFDVENVNGGVRFKRLNGPNPGDMAMYFDHSGIGGDVSGGGAPGTAMPTMLPHAYSGNIGESSMMDYWSYLSIVGMDTTVTLLIDILEDCVDPTLDTDGDKVIDIYDLDDDNDGLPDYLEYCQTAGGFSCLPGGFDPSGDHDKDRVANCMDANDPSFTNPCADLNGDGICDQVAAVYDLDGDGVPNYIDLDSDNDGATDLEEAGHDALDGSSRDGRIDGAKAEFGDNGFYNALSDKPNGPDAKANYQPADSDIDKRFDAFDLDTDNDGIHDIAEHGLASLDGNGDGMIDPSGSPLYDKNGLARDISPLSGATIPPVLDTDGDLFRDARDMDSDNDGIPDVTESLLPDADGDGQHGFGKPVTDALGRPQQDAFGTVLFGTSKPTDTDQSGVPDLRDLDSDEDGVWDSYEAGVADPDLNGVAGEGKPVVDGRGIPLWDSKGNPLVPVSDPPDHDQDGDADFQDVDSDGDGISDRYECFDVENGYTQLPCLDSDSDGQEDILDNDSDNDGLTDQSECPNGDSPDCPDSTNDGKDDFRDPNLFINVDSDGDKVPDMLDLDNDNDGIPDTREFCGGQGFSCLPGGFHPDGDLDNDLIPNYYDAQDPSFSHPCVDTDGNGICDRLAASYDTDGDGFANHVDLDSDDDGLLDLLEAGHDAPLLDMVGMIAGSPADFGANGLYNAISDHPDSPNAQITYTVKNSDADPIRDFLDLDSDNDGIHDVAELGYAMWDTDGDGCMDNGFGLPDVARMGIPRLINPEWTQSPIPVSRDSDKDGVLDAIDLDSDNDGIHDVVENILPDPDGNGQPGTGDLAATETDADGRVKQDVTAKPFQSTTLMVDTDKDLRADAIDLDADGDGIPDVLEAQLQDSDKDGILGKSPISVGQDGVPATDAGGASLASISDPRDLDKDGIPDFQDIDRDGDSIRDGYECTTPYGCVDTDQDGTPDVDDLNSDGDCDTDEQECPGGDPCPDKNGNLVPDFRQFDCCPGFIPILSGSGPNAVACSGKPIVLEALNSVSLNTPLIYTWSGPGFMFTDTVSSSDPLKATVVPTGASAGTYTLQVLTGQGCQGNSLTIDLQVKPTPMQPTIQADPHEVCPGEELFLSTQPYAGSTPVYQWLFSGSGGQASPIGQTSTPLMIIPNALTSQTGFYSVAVTIDGCTSDPSVPIPVLVLPEVNIQAAEDSFVMMLEDQTLQDYLLGNDVFNTGTVSVSLVTLPLEGELTLMANGTFKYTPPQAFLGTVTFTYRICAEQCLSKCDTATVTIEVSSVNVPDTCEVYNIITPNNDGANDALEIPCLMYYGDHELTVFNRWGDQVYRTEKYQQDWAGEWNGRPLPAGTYFYILRVFGKKAQEHQGYFTIIR